MPSGFSVEFIGLCAGLLIELAGGLIVVGMLIKTINLLERVQRAQGRRITRLDRRMQQHLTNRVEHPDRNAIAEIAREVKQE